MATLRSDITLEALAQLPRNSDLSAIPGESGPPLVGHTFTQLRDPLDFATRMTERYGPVYKLNAFGRMQLHLLGPDANELVMLNKGDIFSSDLGWTPTLHFLFPRGLMMLDFDIHRSHRRLMNQAFKPEVMRSYVAGLNKGVSKRVAEWAAQDRIFFYEEVKQLTLELAAGPFLGLSFGAEAQNINQAFAVMVQASIAPIRKPYPFTLMRRGVKARAFLCDYFAREIPKRRGSNASDMLSVLCNAVDEDGNGYSDQEIIDHMNFLMMAAHDTITSSATTLAYELGRAPDWQQRLRSEIQSVSQGSDPIGYDDLPNMPLTEMAFKETLRLHPPVPAIPRRAIKAFDFGGHHIPAGTFLSLSPLYTHAMANHWPEPTTFDPMRFTPEAIKDRHKYAWMPFGGGAHMCLGLHFAYMQAKIVFGHLLRNYEITLPEGYTPTWKPWPICKPADGLPISITPLA